MAVKQYMTPEGLLFAIHDGVPVCLNEELLLSIEELMSLWCQPLQIDDLLRSSTHRLVRVRSVRSEKRK
jgi:hypothetical protein